MFDITRRDFLVGAGLTSIAFALGRFSGQAEINSGNVLRGVWEGPDDLIPDPDGILDLPSGFSYTILETVGNQMSDGNAVPGRPDGMYCFKDKTGDWVLLRNHEIDSGQPIDSEFAFDPARCGGVTRLVIDPTGCKRISSNSILTGTSRNCSGGPTPLGWISCEETSEPGHGYAFMCDISAKQVQQPMVLKDLGRFHREAVAFDPTTGITYMTEDRVDGLVYRHLPDTPQSPFVGGKMQALVVKGAKNFDLSSVDRKAGESFPVAWVDIPDRDAKKVPTRHQGKESGCAIVNRAEGAIYQNRSILFTSTDGGPVGQGQIFRLDLNGAEDQLTIISQAERYTDYQHPDNLTVTPWGEVLIAEDGVAPNHIRLLKANGRVLNLARIAPSNSTLTEFTGLCFSPDGRYLFANLQDFGLTIAITGPFSDVA